LANALGRQSGDEEQDLRHQSWCYRSLVQLEQTAALRCLVKHRGLM
jgi:hypothetical protein